MAPEVLVGAIVGERGTGGAELFKALLAARAGATRVHHAAGSADVADLEFSYLAPDLGDTSDDLMARDAGILGAGPFAAGRVDVGVADATEQNLHLDIRGTRLAAWDAQRGERVGGGRGAEGAGGGRHGEERFS